MKLRDIERTTVFKKLMRHLGFHRGNPTSQELERLSEIRARLLLSIKIRWLVILLLCSYLGYAVTLLSRTPVDAGMGTGRLSALYATLLAVIMCNLVYHLLYRELSHFIIINHIQILLDILFITIIVHFTGGVTSPFWSIYPVIALESSLLLERKPVLFCFAAAGNLAFGSVILAEATGLLHTTVLPFVRGDIQSDPLYCTLVWSWTITMNAAMAVIGSHVIRMLRRREDTLRSLVVKDQMTNLYNRSYFFKELNSEIQRSIRYNHVFSVIFLDVDDFKIYNDIFGHLEGDRLLVELAQIIRRNARRRETATPYDIDVPCRYGGEEFAVILPETPLAPPGTDGRPSEGTNAYALAERIRKEVQLLSSNDREISVSIGLAAYPRHGSTPDELVRAVDTALYQAKNKGKNRIAVAQETVIEVQNGISSSGLNVGSSYPGDAPNPGSSEALPAP